MVPGASEWADFAQAESMRCLAQLAACLEDAIEARSPVTDASASLDAQQFNSPRELARRLPEMTIEPELPDRLLDAIRYVDVAVRR